MVWRASVADVCNALEDHPVIMAVKNQETLQESLQQEGRVIFLLQSNINTVHDQIQRLKEKNKIVFLHLDLLDGLQSKDVAVDFLYRSTAVDGIISTRDAVLKRAHELNLLTVQRFFLLDSLAMQAVKHAGTHAYCDFLEILPGLMPRILHDLSQECKIPILAGGLISLKEDVIAALGAGAMAVSTTNTRLWDA